MYYYHFYNNYKLFKFSRMYQIVFFVIYVTNCPFSLNIPDMDVINIYKGVRMLKTK